MWNWTKYIQDNNGGASCQFAPTLVLIEWNTFVGPIIIIIISIKTQRPQKRRTREAASVLSGISSISLTGLAARTEEGGMQLRVGWVGSRAAFVLRAQSFVFWDVIDDEKENDSAAAFSELLLFFIPHRPQCRRRGRPCSMAKRTITLLSPSTSSQAPWPPRLSRLPTAAATLPLLPSPPSQRPLLTYTS